MRHAIVDLRGGAEIVEQSLGRGVALGPGLPLLCLSLLGAVLVWARCTSLPARTLAAGVVKAADGGVHQVAATDGFVRTLVVEEGAKVARGDLLVSMDDSDEQTRLAEILARKAAVTEQLASLARISATLEAQRALESECEQQELRVLENELRRTLGARRGLEVVLAEELQGAERARRVLERAEALLEEGVISRADGDEAELALAREQSEAESARCGLDSMEAESDSARAALEARKLRNALGQLQGNLSLEELSARRTSAQVELLALESAERLALERKHRLQLRASTEGTVTWVEPLVAGAPVQRGKTLAVIVPSGCAWIVEAQIPEALHGDPAELVGERALLSVDALPHREYGQLEGRVLSISPEARVMEDGRRAYRVEVSLPSRELDGPRKTGSLHLGMGVRLEIHAAEDSALTVLRRFLEQQFQS